MQRDVMHCERQVQRAVVPAAWHSPDQHSRAVQMGIAWWCRGWTGQGKAGQGRTRKGRAGQCWPRQGTTGQGRQDRAYYGRAGQVRAGQYDRGLTWKVPPVSAES